MNFSFAKFQQLDFSFFFFFLFFFVFCFFWGGEGGGGGVVKYQITEGSGFSFIIEGKAKVSRWFENERDLHAYVCLIEWDLIIYLLTYTFTYFLFL